MADAVLDAVESHSDSIASLLSKLPGRRIDAHIRGVAEQGMPEQGEVEGGYIYTYAQLSHLPLFSLYSDKANSKMKAKWDYYVPESKKTFMQGPKPGIKEQAGLMFMNAMNPGMGPGLVTTTKWMGRTIGALDVMAAKAITEQVMLARFTRWTIPAAVISDLGQGKTPWFVDMLELHWPDPDSKRAKMAKVSGNFIAVKAGHSGDGKVTVKFLEFDSKKLKGQKHWSTRYKVKELCEALVLVEGEAEVQMEIVARMQRICSPTESRALESQFEKHWSVPVLRG